MHTRPDCLPCLLKAGMLTAQRVTDDPAILFQAVQAAAQRLATFSPDLSPAEHATQIARAVEAFLGVENPYREQKAHYNALALEAYEALMAYVRAAPDPLAAAVRVAAVGNVMDLNFFEQVDVSAAVEQAQVVEWAIDHTAHLQRDLAAAERILFLGDNAGEIVFDRVLVEALPLGKVTYVVKSAPVTNDVTREDVQQVGMDRAAHIMDTGAAFLGAPLNRCSPAFVGAFEAADVIITKGQANLETLGDVDANLYFILKVKCWPLAREIGVQQGDIVMLSQRARGLHGR